MQEPSTSTGIDLAGSYPTFPGRPGSKYETALSMQDFRRKRLVFNHFVPTERVHVYQAECRAGERLRAQLVYPMLNEGRAVEARFAIVAQSLPYSADMDQLPIPIPAGFRAVVSPRMSELIAPVTDALTRAAYCPGPIIDTRVLVSGRCYILVWVPNGRPGKYVLQVGHRWPLRWSYWTQIPRFWWQIRGWFGLSRAAAYAVGGGLALGLIAAWFLSGKKESLQQETVSQKEA